MSNVRIVPASTPLESDLRAAERPEPVKVIHHMCGDPRCLDVAHMVLVDLA